MCVINLSVKKYILLKLHTYLPYSKPVLYHALLLCGSQYKDHFHEVFNLTYSIQQSNSWEANRFSAGQEIPLISLKPKIYYPIIKCPPPLPISSQLDPIHAPHPTSWRFIIIISSHLSVGLPSGLFPSGFPIKFLYTPQVVSFPQASPSNSFIRLSSPPILATCSDTPFFSI